MSHPGDGYTLYAWQVLEGGTWGVIAAATPTGLHVLVHRNEEVVKAYRPFARMHARATLCDVRLARFVFDGTIEEVAPSDVHDPTARTS